MEPHPNNFCGGNYQDWLEVNLTPDCNAKCSWCVEKKGWHPKEKVSYGHLATSILYSGKKNIILLGGEPTLYKDLRKLIRLIVSEKNVYITTNGSELDCVFIREVLPGIKGVNISIHHYDHYKNEEITGIVGQKFFYLKEKVKQLKEMGIKVRLNCNIIRGYIDSGQEILNYVDWAKNIGVTDVRFAELKGDDTFFVDLSKIVYLGVTDPFIEGCSKDVVVRGVNVNYRLMCGFNTKLRPQHDWPTFKPKDVLYYDGKMYPGWQVEMEKEMKNNKLEKLFQDLYDKKITVAAALIAYEYVKECPEAKEKVVYVDSSPCTY
jgi:MoaA/NifB/PqqE/SkfB family radical SAM enzyme